MLALLLAIDSPLPMAARTAIASAAAATWRIGLTPLDTLKTTLQARLLLPLLYCWYCVHCWHCCLLLLSMLSLLSLLRL